MTRALVLSDSVEFRETIEVLLADLFLLEARPVAACGAPVPGDVGLLVIDGSTADARSLAPGSTPVLWVGGSAGNAPRQESRRRRVVVALDLEGFALREAARALGAEPVPAPPRPSAPILGAPYLPAEAVEVARRAVLAPLPLLIAGEAGTGKGRVARAIHTERGAAYHLAVSSDELNRRAVAALPAHLAAPDEVTLVAGDLALLEPTGQQFLAHALETGELPTADGRSVRTRTIVTSTQDPTALFRSGRLDKTLFYQLNVLNLHLPPLRARAGDIPALVEAVARSLCHGLGLAPVTFTPASVVRLSRYLWFGNLAELEAVVARSIAFATGGILDTKDLLFGYGPVVPRLAPPPRAGVTATVANGASVDLIINELAHEFKNPMVTIKTFAQQFDHLLTDGLEREQVVRLTAEAVERMDQALENLVQFTRFREPSRQPTALGALVTSALHQLEGVVAEKQLALRVEPSPSEVLVDPAQVSYALCNLLRSVIRDLSKGDPLILRAPTAGALRIEYPATARSAAHQLSQLLAAPTDGCEALPLGMAFAKTLIERNGGMLTIFRGPDPVAIGIDFPQAAEGVERDGQGQGTHR